MDKETILVRFISRQSIEDFIKEEIDGKLSYRYEFQTNVIKTNNVNIRCVIVPLGERQIKYVRGMRSQVCFGFDREAKDYLTRGNPKYSGHLINYILEKNGVK